MPSSSPRKRGSSFSDAGRLGLSPGQPLPRNDLYIGVTGDLSRRIWKHREGLGSRFASRYGATRLVHAEPFESIKTAIAREKAIKKWLRQWTIDLIEAHNPDWRDRFDELIGA